jgi:pimeloyl-ACP methyl ester carboxylesterase
MKQRRDATTQGRARRFARRVLATAVLASCTVPDPAVRERTFATPAGALFVRTSGAGPDVVLLHGLGDSSVGWHRIEQPLRDAGFRVTVWDALGAGRSERPDPGDYGLAAHVERLRALFDALGIDRAHVVGNSLGGTMALLFAQFHPERVDRLVLLNPAAYPEGGTTPAWFWQVPGLAETLLARLPPEWLARAMLRYLFGDARRVTAEDVRLYADEAERHAAVQGLILQERQLYPEPAVIERWVAGHQSIAAPALILWGPEDRILPVEQARRLAREMPHAELRMLDGVGHVPQLEVPEPVLAAISEFLRRSGGQR